MLFLCPTQNDLSVPLLEEDLDGSSGLLFPFYDSDTNMLYIVGKVSAFHVSKCCLIFLLVIVVSSTLLRLKSQMLLSHINLEIWTNGMGSESAGESGHIFYCKHVTFTVGTW